MTRLWYLLISIAVVFIALAGCSGNKEAVAVGLGETFTIGVGQTARITGEDMTVTFNGVIGDSRCPQNVTCVWEGVASSKTTIVYQGKEYTIVLNSPGLTEEAKVAFINYTLSYSLNPYPIEGKEIASKDYRLTMVITR